MTLFLAHHDSSTIATILILALAPATAGQINPTTQGIDENGRIPKVEIPMELEHPERWRYFPEGRLIEGNMFERFLVSSFFAPIIFRDADVGTGGGITITDIDFRNQRRQEFANFVMTYSSEGQQTISANWRRWTNHIELPDGGVVQDERSFMHNHASYQKALTKRYFGLGIVTPRGAESSYTRERTALSYHYQFTEPNPADELIFDFGIQFEHNNLSSGMVSNKPDTRTLYAGDFAAGDDHDMLWLNLNIRYDTRDSLHNPYQGWYLGASASTAALQTNGEVGAIFSAFGSKVFTLPPLLHDGGDDQEAHPPTDGLAFGAFVQASSGELPFYSLPTLGGSQTLRGFITNRFTDRTAWHASAEYRMWFIPRGFSLTRRIRIERVGAAFFFEAGSVAPKTAGLFDHVECSYGTSLRISLERTALFRVDFGISDEDTNVSIAYGLTF
ncbi:MAG: BamA/TamA family outer membrane protein [Planctomycetota bacterium]|nr:BamA/TamA family outer membrane protein [Planctomycetota bacterium]